MGIALKAAETDGTKRALATFGKPFGLALYRRLNITYAMLVKFSSLNESQDGFSIGSVPKLGRTYGRPSINKLLTRRAAI